MAVISSALRRKAAAQGTPYPPVPLRKALVAAASGIPLDGSSWKHFKLGDTAWQTEAWNHYDICGELRFVANWIGSSVSRCRLYVAELDELGRPGEEVTDPDIAVLAETVFGGPAKRAEAQRLLGTHLYVPGESYIVAESAASTAEDRWYVVSTSAIKRQGDREIKVERPQEYGGGWYSLKEGQDLLIRAWTPHPRKYDLADSSVRPALPILREIEQLTKHIFAQIDSRLAGAGLLLLPDQLDFPRGEDDPANAEGLMKVLQRAMAAALADRADPSSLVPIMAQVPGEFIDKVRHITFETPLAAAGMEIRDRAIRRLGLSLDVDPEILLGKGDTNHWSAWQLEETTIKVHIEPLLARICDALTTGYLRAALTVMGKDPDAYTYWYDPSPLTVRPNRQEDGLALFDKDALSEEALRTAGAWSEDDKPNEEERARRLATKLVLAQPDLIREKAIREALGVTWEIGAQQQSPAPADQPAQPAQADQQPPKDQPAERALPQQTQTPQDSAQAALVMGAHMVVQRSLEMAGKRLLTRANRDKYRDVPPWELHTVIHVLEPDHAERLLEDTFATVPVLAERTGVPADDLRAALAGYCRELFVRAVPHDIDTLEEYLDWCLHAAAADEAEAWMETAGSFHLQCREGEFCRSPLHPGPCKGWKRKLKEVAPGVHAAMEAARKEKLAKRKAAKLKADNAKKRLADLQAQLKQAEKDGHEAETTADAQKAFKEQARLSTEIQATKKDLLDAEAEHDALLTPATALKNARKAVEQANADVEQAKAEYARVEKELAGKKYNSPEYNAIVAKLEPLAERIGNGEEKAAEASAKVAALLKQMKPKPSLTKKKAKSTQTFEQRIQTAICCQAALDDVEIDLLKLNKGVGTNVALGGKSASDVRHALRQYKGALYHDINKALRNAKGDAKNAEDSSGVNWSDTIEAIDAAHANSKLKQDAELWRGIVDPEKIFGSAWNEHDVSGLEWTDHGYSSATADKNVARSFAAVGGTPSHNKVVMRLLTPAGTPAVKLSGYEHEAELLLPRGTKFRVVNDHGILAGARQLEVEIVHG